MTLAPTEWILPVLIRILEPALSIGLPTLLSFKGYLSSVPDVLSPFCDVMELCNGDVLSSIGMYIFFKTMWVLGAAYTWACLEKSQYLLHLDIASLNSDMHNRWNFLNTRGMTFFGVSSLFYSEWTLLVWDSWEKKVSKILLARSPLLHLKVAGNIVITGLRILGEEMFPSLNSRSLHGWMETAKSELS